MLAVRSDPCSAMHSDVLGSVHLLQVFDAIVVSYFVQVVNMFTGMNPIFWMSFIPDHMSARNTPSSAMGQSRWVLRGFFRRQREPDVASPQFPLTAFPARMSFTAQGSVFRQPGSLHAFPELRSNRGGFAPPVMAVRERGWLSLFIDWRDHLSTPTNARDRRHRSPLGFHHRLLSPMCFSASHSKDIVTGFTPLGKVQPSLKGGD